MPPCDLVQTSQSALQIWLPSVAAALPMCSVAEEPLMYNKVMDFLSGPARPVSVSPSSDLSSCDDGHYFSGRWSQLSDDMEYPAPQSPPPLASPSHSHTSSLSPVNSPRRISYFVDESAFLDEMRAVFDILDVDRKGRITAQAVESMNMRLNSSLRRVESINEQTSISSSDESSSNEGIDFEEFVSIMSSEPANPYEELKRAFDIFDLNKDGRLDRSELKNVFLILGESLSEAELANLLYIADINGDGFVDFGEFCDLMLKGDC
mmetsp:Transcript_10151/g.16638  ORF Transcript_10151/g.16638 Transcript_10151/m.16638 type:complete len:264 (-) Transcript_10151:224-1015(-)